MANIFYKTTSARIQLWMICVAATASLHAETTIPQALGKARSDLAAALSSLEETRAKIAGEKPSISAEFEKTELELREKRRLVRIARLSQQDRTQELRQLRADLNTRSQRFTSRTPEHSIVSNAICINRQQRFNRQQHFSTRQRCPCWPRRSQARTRIGCRS